MGLIVFGLSLCIPVIFFGSGLVAHLMQRFPIIIYVCAGVLVDTSFKMLFKDSLVSPYVSGFGGIVAFAVGAAVVLYGAVRLFT